MSPTRISTTRSTPSRLTLADYEAISGHPLRDLCQLDEQTGELLAVVTIVTDNGGPIRSLRFLQGETVRVTLDQMLYADTGALDVDGFSADIADEAIVEFVPGRFAGDFAPYPGFTASRSGSTQMTMMSDGGDIKCLEFTIEVTSTADGDLRDTVG